MRLLHMTTPQCMLYSLAMLLDVEPEILIKEIGYTGLEIWFYKEKGEKRLRGMHIQEAIDCAIRRGYVLVGIEGNPLLGHRISELLPAYKITEIVKRFNRYLYNYSGLLITETHAAAWNHLEKRVYDPSRGFKNLDDYDVKEFWALIKSA